jgi:hypothetical protein
MSRVIPFGSIPDSNILPDNIYRLKIDKLEEVMSKERDGKASKLMYKLTTRVVEPASHKGLFFTEFFTIGTEEDPEAEELNTWQTSIGGRALKRLSAKLGVPTGDEEDSDAFLAAVKGVEYLSTIITKTEPDEKNGQPNPYKGRVNNQVTAYWALGEREPGSLSEGNGKHAPKTTKTTKPQQQAAPATTDDVSCSACKKRVPRKDLKAHVEDHMKELAAANADE